MMEEIVMVVMSAVPPLVVLAAHSHGHDDTA